jgi:hypothetical protein
VAEFGAAEYKVVLQADGDDTHEEVGLLEG